MGFDHFSWIGRNLKVLYFILIQYFYGSFKDEHNVGFEGHMSLFLFLLYLSLVFHQHYET